MTKIYRVKTEKLPETTNYLTENRWYMAIGYMDYSYAFNIVNDRGNLNLILKDGCAHLDLGSWIVQEYVNGNWESE